MTNMILKVCKKHTQKFNAKVIWFWFWFLSENKSRNQQTNLYMYQFTQGQPYFATALIPSNNLNVNTSVILIF